MTIDNLVRRGAPYNWAGRFRRKDLPDTLDRLPGIVTVADGRIDLRLFGTFPGIEWPALALDREARWTLDGLVEAGHTLTVLDARHVGGRSDSPPGTIEIHLRASAVLLGNRAVDPKSDSFDELEIAFNELPAWTSPASAFPLYGWHNPRVFGPSERVPTPPQIPEVEAAYYARPPLSAFVPGVGRVTVGHRALGWPEPGINWFTEEGAVHIRLQTRRRLLRIDRVRLPFKRLLELSFDREVNHRHLRVHLAGGPPTTDPVDTPRDDRWLYVITGREAGRPDPRRVYEPLAIQANTVNFATLVRTWHVLHREQIRALNYFFGTAYTHDPYTDRGLLSAVIPIEGYHRVDKPVSAAVMTRMKEHVEEARKLVKDARLDRRIIKSATMASEPSLAQRIRDLLDRQEIDLKTAAGPAKRDFADHIAWLRNGVGHLLPRVDEADIIDMYERRQQLLAVMKLELLRRLGATVEERTAILKHMRWPESAPGA